MKDLMVAADKWRPRKVSKMDPMTKGIRELIRTTMRERGIRHSSDHTGIYTVCYAQHPDISVEYKGPILVKYCTNKCCLEVDCFGLTPQDYMSRVFYNCVDRSNEYHAIVWPCKHLVIDIADPNMSQKLGQFLDDHITEDMKRPPKHKELIKGYEFATPFSKLTKYEFQYFVPDYEYEPKRKSFFRRLVSKFFGSRTNDFYWEQALKRRFELSDEELGDIKKTVEYLQSKNKSQVRKRTRAILEQNSSRSAKDS